MSKKLKCLNFDRNNANKTFHYLIKKIVMSALNKQTLSLNLHKILVVATNAETFCLDEVYNDEFEAHESIRFLCLFESHSSTFETVPTIRSVEEIRIAHAKSISISFVYNLTLADMLGEINSSLDDIKALDHCPISYQALTIPTITPSGKSYSEVLWKNLDKGNFQDPYGSNHHLIKKNSHGVHELTVQNLMMNRALFSLICTITLNALAKSKSSPQPSDTNSSLSSLDFEEYLDGLKIAIKRINKLKGSFAKKALQIPEGFKIISHEMFYDLKQKIDLLENRLDRLTYYFERLDRHIPNNVAERVDLALMLSPIFLINFMIALRSKNTLQMCTLFLTLDNIVPMILAYLLLALAMVQISVELEPLKNELAHSIDEDIFNERTAFYKGAIDKLNELEINAKNALTNFTDLQSTNPENELFVEEEDKSLTLQSKLSLFHLSANKHFTSPSSPSPKR